MKNIRKGLMTAGVTTAVGVATFTGVGLVSAATDSSSTSTNPATSLVQKIATKFNLKESDVQAVFDQDHTEREAEQTKKISSDLDSLVSSGKITADQKQKILDKRAELEKQREADRTAMDNKTDAERKTAMDAQRTALEKWASDNGIAKEYLRYVFVGGHGGPGGHGFGGDKAPASSNNQ